MTPSGWHNDTMARDAGHDDMQFRFWKDLKENGPPKLTVSGDVFDRYAVSFEYAFEVDGAIIGFGDIVEWFSRDRVAPSGQPEKQRVVRIWEIKPKIHSLGGIVRQVEAIECLAKKWSKNWGRHASDKIVRVDVWTVVPQGDPKVSMLMEVLPGQVFQFDPSRGRPNLVQE